MSISVRLHLTAGIAILSVAAIALTPMQQGNAVVAPSPIPTRDLAVGLAASIDPTTPWLDILHAAANNASGLAKGFAEQGVGLFRAIAANPAGILKGAKNALAVPFTPDIDSLDGAHLQLFNDIVARLPKKIADLLLSPAADLGVGLAGPILAPLVQLSDNFKAITDNIRDSEWTAALKELINIPAKLVNAFLNGGQTIDITKLISRVVAQPKSSAGLHASNISWIPTGGTGGGTWMCTDSSCFGWNSGSQIELALGGVLSRGSSAFGDALLFQPVAPAVGVEQAPTAHETVGTAPPVGDPVGIFGTMLKILSGITTVYPHHQVNPKSTSATTATDVTAQSDWRSEAPVAAGRRSPRKATAKAASGASAAAAATQRSTPRGAASRRGGR